LPKRVEDYFSPPFGVWDAWGQHASAAWKCLRGNSCLAITWRSPKHTEKESQERSGLGSHRGLDASFKISQVSIIVDVRPQKVLEEYGNTAFQEHDLHGSGAKSML
jgi:hypothetical protein